MKLMLKSMILALVFAVLLFVLPEDSSAADCWGEKPGQCGDHSCGSGYPNSVYSEWCCYRASDSCAQCGRNCSPPPPPPSPPPSPPPPPPPPPQPACSSVCWDDRSCSGSDQFAGYTTNKNYPVRCCSNGNGNRCNTGITSSPVICPDSICSPGEDARSCPQDCALCPDNSCNGRETCWNGQNGCAQDCGSCRSLIYSNENSWCMSNCGADNSPNGRIECGPGFEKFSRLYCNSLPPAGSGITCGTTCKAQPVCGNGRLELPNEACDDENNQNGDGCTGSCNVESGYTCSGSPKSTCTKLCGNNAADSGENCTNCPQDISCPTGKTCNVNTASCVIAAEVCWDGIDNNANGQVDENCRGCADLNNDNRVEWNDFFMIADCETGLTAPTASCPANVFNKVDWNDNNVLELEGAAVGENPADLNGDRLVDWDDFAILNSNMGKTGRNAADINKDGKVDTADFFILADQYGERNSDLRCFFRNWGRNIECRQQSCSAGVSGEDECYSNVQCQSGLCSKGRDGKDAVGHCCQSGFYWNSDRRECQQLADLNPCDVACTENILTQDGKINRAFFNDKNCFDLSQGRICVKTKRFTPESKKFYRETSEEYKKG